MNIKKYLLGILFFSFTICLFGNSTFAADQNQCEAKYQTPKKLQEYLDNMQNLIGSISVDTSDNTSSGNSSTDEYENEISKIGKGTVKTAENLGNKVGQTIEEAMPFANSEFNDFFLNFRILNNSDTVIRDWTKILALDKILSKKISLVSIRTLKDETVTDGKELQKINEMFSKFQMFNQTSSSKIMIPSGTKKTEILGLLWSMNMYYKALYLEATSTPHNKSDLSDIEGFFKENAKKFNIPAYNPGYLNELSAEYKGCAGLDMTFGEFFSKFSSGVDDITDMGSGGFNKTWGSMKGSYSNLKCFLFNTCDGGEKQSQKMEDRQSQVLMNNGYNPQGGGVDNMFGLGKAWSNVKEGMNLDALKKIDFSWVDNFTDVPKIPEKEQPITQALNKKVIIDNYKAQMKSQFTSILYNQSKGVSDIVLEDPKYLKSFPELSKKVYNVIKVVGDPNGGQDDNTLVGNLGKACEGQAKNAGGICN